jgi:hypothetical protein
MKGILLLLGTCSALTVLALAVPHPVAGQPQAKAPEAAKPDRTVVECVVSLETSKDGCYIQLRLTDPDMIKQLVEDPLDKARVEQQKAAYVVVGMITMKRKDGATDGANLYGPWGKVGRGKKLYTADLQALRKQILESLEETRRDVSK